MSDEPKPEAERDSRLALQPNASVRVAAQRAPNDTVVVSSLPVAPVKPSTKSRFA